MHPAGFGLRQSDVSDRWRAGRPGDEPRLPCGQRFWPHSSVSMSLEWKAWWLEGKRNMGALFVLRFFFLGGGARLEMAGPVDLQGFRSQNLVNISEALYGLLESPRRLEGARACVCLPHILPLRFTSASVHHQEGKRKRKRRPAVVHCLPYQNGKKKRGAAEREASRF